MTFDFANAQLPKLAPLEGSFAENEVEADLKAMFLSLFNTMLAPALFDVNVLGATHLGSLDLVRRTVNSDGLVLLQGDREEAATRYLYRAWKSENQQGRGLAFLRTYLQMLYPNQCEVEQLWQEKTAPYPTALRSTLPAGEEGDYFLTSRVRVLLYYGAVALEVSRLADILQAVMPARFVPEFQFVLRAPDAALRMATGLVVGDVVEIYPQSVELVELDVVLAPAVGLSVAETVDVFT